jgi:hypothetical protein
MPVTRGIRWSQGTRTPARAPDRRHGGVRRAERERRGAPLATTSTRRSATSRSGSVVNDPPMRAAAIWADAGTRPPSRKGRLGRQPAQEGTQRRPATRVRLAALQAASCRAVRHQPAQTAPGGGHPVRQARRALRSHRPRRLDQHLAPLPGTIYLERYIWNTVPSPFLGLPTEAVQRPVRVKVTCVTPLGEEVASIW